MHATAMSSGPLKRSPIRPVKTMTAEMTHAKTHSPIGSAATRAGPMRRPSTKGAPRTSSSCTATSSVSVSVRGTMSATQQAVSSTGIA